MYLFQGRVLISKAEWIYRLIYPALFLYVDSNMCSKIGKMLYKLIWRGKTEYVKGKTIIRNVSEGGVNALDINTINNVFKMTWIKHCLCENNFPWFSIPNIIIVLNMVAFIFYLPVSLNAIRSPLSCLTFTNKLWIFGFFFTSVTVFGL